LRSTGAVDRIIGHYAETVAERIVRYASVLGRENMIAGVACGFDTAAQFGQVDPKIAWAKLSSLAEGANLASRTLWS
jgi:5-methyltetrahydropteroyltriglutamate--homocysteine methyltransferase